MPATCHAVCLSCGSTLLLLASALPAQSPPSQAPAANWPRFNGRDLSGWKVVEQHFFNRHGQVRWNDGAAVLAAGQPGTAIAWTGDMPRRDYEVTLEARRLEGDDFFCGLTFPVQDNYCTLILGGWGGGTTGLSNINDEAAVENETTGYHEFRSGQWYPIRLRVAADRIQAWIDTQQIVDVDTTGKRFSIWWEQEPCRPFGIASWNTSASIRHVRVTRVTPR